MPERRTERNEYRTESAGRGSRVWLLGCLLLSLGAFVARAEAIPPHLDASKNRLNCFACHAGHGKRNTPMLRKTVPDLCFDCHGPFASMPTSASTDVYYEIERRFAHPVQETAHFHRSGETLPETDPVAPRHVSCLDCHNHHAAEKENPIRDVPGLSVAGEKKRKAAKVSEVCYKCHAESANKPGLASNVRELFDPINASFHPVEFPARDRSRSILNDGVGKKIQCTDCHSPHGSDHEHMLIANYSTADGAETPYTYELCYTCHRRDTVLSDESFSAHRRHVVYANIACSACHSPHGSFRNKRLIEFRTDVALPNKAGLVSYVKIGKRNECYLNCHGVEHSGAQVETIRKIPK